MGSCSSRKQNSRLSMQYDATCTQIRSKTKSTWMDKFTQQPKEKIVIPYNPNSQEYQYNVEVDGIIFDVIAPPDLLDDDEVIPQTGQLQS